MPHDGNAKMVDPRLQFEVIEDTTQPPGPGSDRSPLMHFRCLLTLTVKEGMDAIFPSVIEIGVDVSIVGGYEAITPFHDGFDGPSGRENPPRSLS